MNIKRKATILSVKEISRGRLQVKVSECPGTAIGMEFKGQYYLVIKRLSRNRLILQPADEPLSSKEAQSV